MGRGKRRPQGPTRGDKIAAFRLPVLEMSWNRAVPFQNRSIPFHIRGVGKGTCTVERDDFRAHRIPSRARERPHKSARRHVYGCWSVCARRGASAILSSSIIPEADCLRVPTNVHAGGLNVHSDLACSPKHLRNEPL